MSQALLIVVALAAIEEWGTVTEVMAIWAMENRQTCQKNLMQCAAGILMASGKASASNGARRPTRRRDARLSARGE